MDRTVVVTGMGAITALGASVDKFWESLLLGRSGVRPIREFDVSDCSTRFGAEVDSRLIYNTFSSKEINRTSRVSLMAILAAAQAIENACLKGSAELERAGIILGCSLGGFVASEPYFRKGIRENRASPFAIPKPMNSAPASNVSIANNIKGLSMTIDTACSSANHAIGMAAQLITAGVLDIVLVGGADTPFSPWVFRSWCALRALSTANDSPASACKPFSKNRDGTVLGEGAGMLILEARESALRRGATPLARIAGYGASSDAFHVTMPTSEGMAAAMEMALTAAGLAPEAIDLINAHATATANNDSAETQAIKDVMGADAHRIPVNGIKANIGHTLAASAALEAIACVQSLNAGLIPPLINYEEPDEACDLPYVIDNARQRDLRHIMSPSFAFGGSNGVIIFSRV